MYLPQIDVCERETEVVILVEIPGVDRADIHIAWKNDVLTISGTKRREVDPGIASYMCVERNYGPFRREIVISMAIDHKNAKAELRDGLMKIRLPKTQEHKASSTIPIE